MALTPVIYIKKSGKMLYYNQIARENMGKRYLLSMFFLVLFTGASTSLGFEGALGSDGKQGPLIEFLIESQNQDGGWGFGYGNQSFTESTAFVLLALSGSCPANECESAIMNGRSWILEAQNPDGGWGTTNSDPSNIKTGIVLYSLYNSGPDQTFESSTVDVAIERGIGWLISHREYHNITAVKGGWAWTPGTYDFAEPTAYGVMGISANNSIDLSEAISVIYDRQDTDGGWSIARVEVSQPIQTSVVLSALRTADIAINENITRGVNYLEKNLKGIDTPLSSAWALIALDSYSSLRASELAENLDKMAIEERFSNPYEAAIVLIALEGHNRGKYET